MANWAIKLHDTRNHITKYDCGLFTLEPVFNEGIDKAVIYGTRQEARDIINRDKDERPDFYEDLKRNKIYVYPVKVLITEAP